ncbi:hypothetical protein D3C84_1310700 [compost metagenome]
MPVGLHGEFSIRTRAFGVSAALSWAGDILNPLSGVVVTSTGVAPVMLTRSE